MGARGHRRSRKAAPRKSDRAYDAHGRRFWPPLSSGFLVKVFMDGLGAAAGKDRWAFRMKIIGGDRKIPMFGNEKEPPLNTARLKGVLQLAAEKAGWGKPLPKGQGRGIATFYSFNSYTAAVAEASVKDGAVKLHRLVYAVDCRRPI